MALLPVPHLWRDFTMIQTAQNNYSALDYKTLFEKANIEDGHERFRLVNNMTANLIPPGVDTTHIYNTGVDTPESFVYSKPPRRLLQKRPIPSQEEDFDYIPETIYGEGDGTVNLKSLRDDISHWKQNNNGYVFNEIVLNEDMAHSQIIHSGAYIKAVIKLLT